MKRINIFTGHYGSGKTEIAVNFALKLKEQHEKVVICDMDIVNPYFRTKDSIDDFKARGIELICSEYANTNVDIPALPKNYQLLFTGEGKSVADVGGDGDGAAVLGLSHDEYIEYGYPLEIVFS